jgi:hypothetical protein
MIIRDGTATLRRLDTNLGKASQESMARVLGNDGRRAIAHGRMSRTGSVPVREALSGSVLGKPGIFRDFLGFWLRR